MKDTYFAPAIRSTESLLKEEIKIITESPLIDMLMTTIGGLVAVLDRNREIVATNQTLVKMLGIKDMEDVLGRRPGEVLQCVHASESAGGCGTTKSCRTCGAVIAIVSSLELNEPVEKTCIVETVRNGITGSLYLGVRAAPIEMSGHHFILLFLQDLSAQQKLATLEKVFFHDINNILTGLSGNLDLLVPLCKGEALKMATRARKSARNLSRELSIQQIISGENVDDFDCLKEKISVTSVLEEVCDTAKYHPATGNKTIAKLSVGQDWTISSDRYLIVKILTNMLFNGLESSDPGSTVKVWAEKASDGKTVFAVWNKAEIPEDIQQRIFQKNYTTKKGKGRGLGTYSMKVFGEKILKGEVFFRSDVAKGTTFFFKI